MTHERQAKLELAAISLLRILVLLWVMILACVLTAGAQLPIGPSDTTTKIPVIFKASADGTLKTDVSSPACKRTKNGGATASCAGTLAEVSDSDTPGLWMYTLAAGDVDTVGSLVLYFTATGAETFAKELFVGRYPSNVQLWNAVGVPALTDGNLQAVSGTTLTLVSGGVDVDDQFNGSLIAVFDTAGALKAKACIVDSVNSNDTVVTAQNISSFISNGDAYLIDDGSGCSAIVTTNNDKTGYALTQTFPSNFASMAIDGSGRITVGSMNTDSISAAAVSAAAGNKIADHVLRRRSSNLEASSDGDTLNFQSLYGAVAKLTNNVTIAAGVMTIKKADGTTTFASQNVTAAAGAAPITGISN